MCGSERSVRGTSPPLFPFFNVPKILIVIANQKAELPFLQQRPYKASQSIAKSISQRYLQFQSLYPRLSISRKSVEISHEEITQDYA